MITAERVRELLDYDPETGELAWRILPTSRNGHVGGAIAGGVNKLGYRCVMVDHKHCLAHRLIWLWVTGSWPKHQIDHRDLNKSNNRWKNLRMATAAQNAWNRPRSSVRHIKKTNSWIVRIAVNGKRHTIGMFKTRVEALAAYANAANHFHGEFARTE